MTAPPAPAVEGATGSRLDCDVLVVGGGLAGAVAALSARKAGARVALARRAPGRWDEPGNPFSPGSLFWGQRGF